MKYNFLIRKKMTYYRNPDKYEGLQHHGAKNFHDAEDVISRKSRQYMNTNLPLEKKQKLPLHTWSSTRVSRIMDPEDFHDAGNRHT